jgi:hypothetical protein
MHVLNPDWASQFLRHTAKTQYGVLFVLALTTEMRTSEYRLSRKPRLPGHRSLTPSVNTNRTPSTPVYLLLEHLSGVP